MLESALIALIIFGAALEAFLSFGKGYLLGTRQNAALDESIKGAQADLLASKKKIDERRAALKAAADDADRARGEMQEADKLFAESQKVIPTLVHVIGMPYSGMRFRASVSKDLPPSPVRSQKMIWGCNNFVEVWADDLGAAAALAAKQFQEKQGYKVGELVPFDPEPRPAAEAAPQPLPEAAA